MFAALLRVSGLFLSQAVGRKGRKEKMCMVGKESKGKKVFSTEHLRVTINGCIC